MVTYTSCQRCQKSLIVSFVGQETHPSCEPTESEKLAREFVDAIQRGDDVEAQRLERVLNAPVKVPSLGSSALWYVKTAKWPVFPILPGEKRPATKHGFRDASRDPDQVRKWWTENPQFNIGVPTGAETGFDVVDVDGPSGMRSLAELGDDVLPPVHGKVGTPRGVHLLVPGTNDGNRAGVRPGLDYRSSGGYVLVPGSVVDGKRYVWLVPPSPEIMGKAS